MSNNKQSSLEWFDLEIWNLQIRLENKEITIGEYGVTYVDLLNQAKAMHKEEIIKSWMVTDNELQRIAAEQYYNETFGDQQ